MNKLLILLIAVSFIGFSCKKDEEVPPLPFSEQRTIDSLAVANYLEDNNITNVLKDCYTVEVDPGNDCEGYVNYVLHQEGAGLIPPSVNAKIEVSYTGRLMDTGVEFDTNDSIQFTLSNLISGWQVILLDMQEGDSVTMYIPSVYAYGSNGSGDKVPANANLIFEMKLHRVF